MVSIYRMIVVGRIKSRLGSNCMPLSEPKRRPHTTCADPLDGWSQVPMTPPISTQGTAEGADLSDLANQIVDWPENDLFPFVGVFRP